MFVPRVACFVACVLAPLPAGEITIAWNADSSRSAVEVLGVPAHMLASWRQVPPASDDWPKRFAIRVGENPTDLPAIAGSWSVAGERLRFEPRFPFEPGVTYRAEFCAPDSAPVVSLFRVPARVAAPTTSVTAVYPAADVLPENQLKFYVQFSAPMSRGRIYEHVRLRDANGRDIELPFLELDEELWDPAMTRLTLLIDPGRIKRGVRPLEDIGAVFEQGNRYSLFVAAACEDAAGQPLRAAYEKNFRIGPADRTPPDPMRWIVRAPRAGTRAPLVVEFDEPMDHALALRLITVERRPHPPIAGEPALSEGDRQWRFVPAEPWQSGGHRLVVTTTIEDLAGNNIGKAFDVALDAGVQRRLDRTTVALAFEVR